MICDLCPRRCGALRTEERGLGRCRMPELPVLARAALHRWEEPPISGTRGSGTIFFSGCSLGCVFCQNEEISHRDFGKAVTLERLARICGELVDQGAHNLNFVNPTHYAHVVGRLLEEHPQPVPVVWNSGGYDRVDTLRGGDQPSACRERPCPGVRGRCVHSARQGPLSADGIARKKQERPFDH